MEAILCIAVLRDHQRAAGDNALVRMFDSASRGLKEAVLYCTVVFLACRKQGWAGQEHYWKVHLKAIKICRSALGLSCHGRTLVGAHPMARAVERRCSSRAGQQ